jgi:hypothetical protein
MFWCHSIDLKFLHIKERVHLLLKFVFVSNFSIFVAARSELLTEKFVLP